MVHHCWSICDLCNIKIIGELNIWIPVCITCAVDLKNFFFHYECVRVIFDYRNHKIFNAFEKEFEIKCEQCETNVIGFDYISLDS